MPNPLTIGVDIGGTHIISAAVDPVKGQIIDGTSFHAKVNHKASKDQIFKQWASAINQTIQQVKDQEIKGIGFAMPGPFNYQTGIAKFEGTGKYLHLFDSHIENEFRPYLTNSDLNMRFHNDATAFGMGTCWLGQAKGYTKAMILTLGTGLGSAYFENGIPIVRRADVAPEGCLWHLSYREDIADAYFSTRWFVRNWNAQSNTKINGVKDLALLAISDSKAKDIFNLFGKNLAQFLSPWMDKFQTEVLVIGGNIAKAFHLFNKPLQEGLDQHQITSKVFPSLLMEDAALIGSARLFEEAFWNLIKNDLPTL